MGRPKKEWNSEHLHMFENLCAIQATQGEICQVMGVDKKTLLKLIAENYPDTPTWDSAYEVFSAKGKISLRRRMWAAAEQGDKTMLIYLSKNYLGMSDTGAQTEKEPPRESKLIAFRGGSQAKAANA